MVVVAVGIVQGVAGGQPVQSVLVWVTETVVAVVVAVVFTFQVGKAVVSVEVVVVTVVAAAAVSVSVVAGIGVVVRDANVLESIVGVQGAAVLVGMGMAGTAGTMSSSEWQ